MQKKMFKYYGEKNELQRKQKNRYRNKINLLTKSMDMLQNKLRNIFQNNIEQN